MARMPSNLCFRLVDVKFLLTAKNVITVTLFSFESYWWTLKPENSFSQLGHFLFYFPFKGGNFTSVDLEIGVCVCLREVFAYGKLKM